MAQPDLGSATVGERAADVVRSSYGRLLAVLAFPTGDIPAAEDALSDAFAQALVSWPSAGIPDNPEGWILTVARNRLRDLWKSAATRTSTPLGDRDFALTMDFDPDLETIPDKRLELLFVCAHPALDAGVRTPLMLQTVLGFESAQIAAAFAVPEATMAQRLVRAKRRIRDARIPFVLPTVHDMPHRLPAVLEAVYGAYAIDWQAFGDTGRREPLAAEALYLSFTLATLLPDEPEVLGLAALAALSHSRAAARTPGAGAGAGIPLDDQDVSLWDTRLIARGEGLLRRAHAFGRIGRFQLEAAIQSAHCDRARTGKTDWEALKRLHEALVRVSPTLGARVALAATIGEVDGPDAGLAALDELTRLAPEVAGFQPAWATRAHLCRAAARIADARLAYQRAIALAPEGAVRRGLEAAAAGLP